MPSYSTIGGLSTQQIGVKLPPEQPPPSPDLLPSAEYSDVVRKAIAGDAEARQKLLAHRRARSAMNARR